MPLGAHPTQPRSWTRRAASQRDLEYGRGRLSRVLWLALLAHCSSGRVVFRGLVPEITRFTKPFVLTVVGAYSLPVLRNIGAWEANAINGQGEYTGEDGRCFKGGWCNSVIHGVGHESSKGEPDHGRRAGLPDTTPNLPTTIIQDSLTQTFRDISYGPGNSTP